MMSSRGKMLVNLVISKLDKRNDVIQEIGDDENNNIAIESPAKYDEINNSDASVGSTNPFSTDGDTDYDPKKDSDKDSSDESFDFSQKASPVFSPITPRSKKKTFKKNGGKKRKAVSNEWIRNKIKKQCNSGQEYVNSKGKLTPERKIQDPSRFQEEREIHSGNHKNHLHAKELARTVKGKDKEDAIKSEGKQITCCFDFQKILTCPNSEVNALYYKRKFAVYNFTIYDIGNKQGICNVWHESIAKRGGNEVASCLYNFINSKTSEGIKDFVFWSDNCPGQNRNKIVFSFYSWVSTKLKINIKHKFLEKGHTQNEGDSMHSVIERAKKGITIYVPMQWYSLIRNAKSSGQKYVVNEMTNENFFDFREFSQKCSFKFEDKMSVSHIKEAYFTESLPFIMLIKENLYEDEYINCILYSSNIRGRKRNNPFEETIKLLYDRSLPISVKKKNDLMDLCRDRIIPRLYHEFYENLNASNINSDDSDTGN